MAAPKENLVALDGLRFGLAIYLVLFHTFKNYPEIESIPWLHSLLSLGFFSTSAFFVLSGFLLTHVYLGRKQQAIAKRDFFIKRLTSLYPIHIFALVLAIPLAMTASGNLGSVMVDHNVNGWSSIAPDTTAYALSFQGLLANIGLNLTLLQAWNPCYTLFNQPAWSLSALLFFYICFPYMAPRLNATRRPTLLLVAVCTLYALPAFYMFFSNTVTPMAHGLMHRNPIIRLPEFLSGILLYTLYRARPAWLSTLLSPNGKRATTVFIVACFVATALLYRFVGGQWYYLAHNGLLLPSQLALVLLCADANWQLGTTARQWLSRLGVASLSIFALHIPLQMVASKAEKVLYAGWEVMTTSAPISELAQIAMSADRSIWMYPMYMGVLLISCILFQEKVVTRTRDMLRARLLPRKQRKSAYPHHADYK
ncbi:acyltransferase family protein [Larsenimonas suaedae]|uniref:Acyltransferase n=1 Tax=Larsenimonas suaedae TaxID=1851019 RepID=A0ABU1GY10_9GAMM|nr:acyltransferase [Larsenimonas suaedae]MCM2972790.1 acyltransferase [Larsenimonas suaedae]MDR5896889.1 acyltransferase [Larsenimonas suaedae]